MQTPSHYSVRAQNSQSSLCGRSSFVLRVKRKQRLLSFASAACILLFSVQGAAAATITVMNTADSGAGSLRAAIVAASSGDTINFSLPANSTITLTSAELLVDKNLIIMGPGANQLNVQRSTVLGTPTFRIFHITNASTVTISGLTISNGSSGAGDGAGILSDMFSNANVTDSIVSGNATTSGSGSGISNDGNMMMVVNCTISGNSGVSADGGGLFNGGTLNVSNSTFSGNSAGDGAGIYNDATMTVTTSTITGNFGAGGADGGGVYNNASGTLTNCTLSNNNTGSNGGDGGGVYSNGTTTLTNCTLSSNMAGNGDGGGIYTEGTTIVTNCALSGNTASNGDGGGLYNFGTTYVTNSTINANSCTNCDGGGLASPAGTSFVTNSTVSGNSTTTGDGGGISMFAGTVLVKNTIVALNTSDTGPDVSGDFTSQGFNLIGKADGSTGFTNGMNGDQAGTIAAPLDPLLGPLQNNGGPTFTQALLAGSTAIDKGAAATDPFTSAAITTDERGFTRPIDRPAPNASGGNGSDIGAFEVQSPSQLVNISTRESVLTGDDVLIGGFIVTGTTPKKVAIRALGPSLAHATQPVAGALPDPVLELHEADGTIVTNNDWMTNSANDQATITMAGLDKFNGLPISDLESIIIATLQPVGGGVQDGSPPSNTGLYSAIVRGNGGGTGVALVEVYDLDGTTTAQLANISTRGFVQTVDNVMIAGFIVGGGGGGGATVLVRAIGPSLTARGVSGVLADPTLELHDANGVMIASDDNWQDTQKDAIMATTIPPANAAESAIVDFLPPGNYSAIVKGVNGTTGVALVEVYNLN